MTSEKVSSLLKESSDDITLNNSYHGYGLKNVVTRIRLYYGGNFGITFESNPNMGTKVYVRIAAELNNYYE